MKLNKLCKWHRKQKKEFQEMLEGYSDGSCKRFQKSWENGKLHKVSPTSSSYVKKVQQMSLNTNVQKAAVEYINTEAQKSSDAAKEEMIKRFTKLGLDNISFENTLMYIREIAPMIIHFRAKDVLKKFSEDYYYRNLFETKTSNGTTNLESRTTKEDKIFNHIYKGADGSERIKYGALNFLNSSQGISLCNGYGESFLILKNNVRFRTTIASCNTFGSNVILGNCMNFCHLLTTFSDNEIKNLSKVAGGDFSIKTYSGYNYKEIQIHGNVDFAKDIEKIVLGPNNADLIKVAQRFARENEIELIIL